MARLPIPHMDNGAWGQILNDYLSQSLASDGSLKPGVVGGQQVADGALPQAKVQDLQSDLAARLNIAVKGAANGVASLDGSTKVPIAQLPTGTTPTTVALGSHTHTIINDSKAIYPLSAIGGFTASFGLDDINAVSSIGSAFFARIFIPASHTITAIGLYVALAGTVGAGGENGFAVYDDNGNFIAATPTDNALWSAVGWRSKAFATPIPAQSSDRFVYVSPLINGYISGINILYMAARDEISDGLVGFAAKRRSFYTSFSSWPSSFDPATFGNPGGGFVPFIALA